MVLILRDKYGNAVEPITSQTDTANLMNEKQPIKNDQERIDDKQVRDAENRYALKFMNDVNPLGFAVKPIAAGLISAFSDEDYDTVRRKMDEREARDAEILAKNSPNYKKVLDASSALGSEITNTAALMGTAQAVGKIPGVVKTAQKAVSAANKVPGVKQVISGVTSGNPLVRSLSLGGVGGTASTAYNLAQGDDLATAATKGLGTAANLAGYSLAGHYLPNALAIAAPLYEMGKGYVQRSMEGKESNLEDFAGDTGRGLSNWMFYKGMRPAKGSAVKGEPKTKTIDVFKKAANTETPNIAAEYKGMKRSTPLLEASTTSSAKLATAIGEADAKNPYVAKMRRQRDLVGNKIKATIGQETPLVKADTKAMETAADIEGKKVDAIKRKLKTTDRIIPKETVDKYLKPDTEARLAFDRAYDEEARRFGTGARPDGDYRASAVLDTKAHLSDPKNAPAGGIKDPEIKAQAGARKILTKGTEVNPIDYKKQDLAYSKVENAYEKAVSGGAKNKEYVYKNILQELERDELPGTGSRFLNVPKESSYVISKDVSDLAKKYDFLSGQMDRLSNTRSAVNDATLAKVMADAAISGNKLPGYPAAKATTSMLLRHQMRNQLNELGKLRVQDIVKRLKAKYGSVLTTSELAKIFGRYGVSAGLVEKIVNELPKKKGTTNKKPEPLTIEIKGGNPDLPEDYYERYGF